jgi:hypothetical protein
MAARSRTRLSRRCSLLDYALIDTFYWAQLGASLQPRGPSPRLVPVLLSPTTRSVPAAGACSALPNHEVRPRGWCLFCSPQPRGPSPRLVPVLLSPTTRSVPAAGASPRLVPVLLSPTTRSVPAVGAFFALSNHEVRPRGWCLFCSLQPRGPSPRLVPVLLSPTTRSVPAAGACSALSNHEVRPRGWCLFCAFQPRGPSPRLAPKFEVYFAGVIMKKHSGYVDIGCFYLL